MFAKLSAKLAHWRSMTHDELFMKAVAAGCRPFWHDGILGPAWHCGCEGLDHACDQQSSMITVSSVKKKALSVK